MRTAGTKILSLALAALLALGMLPQTVLAVGATPPEGAGRKIIAFEALSDSVANQTKPLGTSLEDLNLPDTLTATVEAPAPAAPEDSDDTDHTGSTQQTGSVPVTEWTAEPKFDPDTLGTYVFTPVLDEGWSLADGVEIPTITVQMVMGIMQLASDLSSFTFDISEGNITIEAGTDPNTLKVSYGGGLVQDNIPNSKEITLTGAVGGHSGESPIKLKASCSVKLDNLDITSSRIPIEIIADPSVKVDISLSGSNTLFSTNDHGFGLSGKLSLGHEVTISGSGSLSVTGKYGIDIGNGTQLVITGEADVTARGLGEPYDQGYGIGSGILDMEDTCTLTISGNAKVRAEGTHKGISGKKPFDVILKDSAQVWATGNAVFKNSEGTSLYLLEITVTDSANAPVEGALVQSGSHNTTTDENGKAYLYIPSGEKVALIISKTGYVTVQESTFSKGRSAEQKSISLQLVSETPVISGQPQSSSYNQGDAPAAISVTASVSDGGTLSYQWYRNITNSDTGGTLISGATENSYTPDTNVVGIQYYYCIVTNTNASVDGTPTATSNVARIIVNRFGGGSSSDDDDSDSRSEPTVTIVLTKQPNQPTIGSVFGKVAGSNTQRTFTITDSLVKSALEKAQAEAKAQNRTAYGIGAQLVLDAPATAGLTVTFEHAALNRLVSVGAKQFEITGAPISLTLDAKALAELQKQGTGNVTITIKPVTVKGVRNAYDISFSYIKNGKTANITRLDTGTAMFSIPCTPAKGEAVGGFYAVYVDGKGKVSRIADSSYDANSGSVMFSTDHFSVYGVGYTAPSAKFTDTVKHWAAESIDYVVGRGLLSGSSETTFAPDTAMTRGMLVTALGRLAGVEVKSYTTYSFTDVKSDSAFRPYIEWAYSKGIVQGIGSNQFAPDRVITREEIALIFANYAKITGYTLPVTRTATTYADASSIGSTYKTAVTAMQQAGIMMGGTNNKFNPKASATRAEVSSMLHRYIKLTIDPTTAQGWAKNDAGLHLYYKDGKAVTGTQTIDGVKYSFETTGILKTGWLKDDSGNWHFYSGNILLVGWWDIGANGSNERYYFDIYGNMVSGKWLQIEGKWYYFNADGSLARSTTVDGYEIDENGMRKTK